MLTELEVRQIAHKRAWILIPGIVIGLSVVVAYFGCMHFLREGLISFVSTRIGPTAADLMPVLLVLPAFGLLLLPIWMAENACKRYLLICPHCEADVTRSASKLLLTRCCVCCGHAVLDGNQRDHAFCRRYDQFRWSGELVWWLALWPALAAALFAWHWLNPSALMNCTPMLLLPGLVGGVSGGWAYVRTGDRRYLLPLGFSALFLLLGGVAYRTTL